MKMWDYGSGRIWNTIVTSDGRTMWRTRNSVTTTDIRFYGKRVPLDERQAIRQYRKTGKTKCLDIVSVRYFVWRAVLSAQFALPTAYARRNDRQCLVDNVPGFSVRRHTCSSSNVDTPQQYTLSVLCRNSTNLLIRLELFQLPAVYAEFVWDNHAVFLVIYSY